LHFLRQEYEYVEIPNEEYERLQQAIKDTETPFLSVNDFIEHQIGAMLEKHAGWSAKTSSSQSEQSLDIS
jgi:hypothetical protein